MKLVQYLPSPLGSPDSGERTWALGRQSVEREKRKENTRDKKLGRGPNGCLFDVRGNTSESEKTLEEQIATLQHMLPLLETASAFHVQSLETPVAALFGEESSTYSCRSCNVSRALSSARSRINLQVLVKYLCRVVFADLHFVFALSPSPPTYIVRPVLHFRSDDTESAP